MKRSHAMRAARAEQKRKTWVRNHAALFADNLETQLARSLHLIHQEDGAPLMYISPADLLAIAEWRDKRNAGLAETQLDFSDDELH